MDSIKTDSKQEKGVLKILLGYFLDSVVGVLWFYVLCQVFIFDLDAYLIRELSPNFSWLVEYKFFILIGLVSAVWLFTETGFVVKHVLYVLFFPFIVIFWKIPRFIFKKKSWNFAFFILNSILSYFGNLKFNFIVTAVYLISFIGVFQFQDKYVLCGTISVLLALVFVTYIEMFKFIYKPSKIFQVYEKIFVFDKEENLKIWRMENEVKELSLDKWNSQQIQKRVTNLQTIVLFNRFCLFGSKKLKDFQESGLNIITYVLNILFIIVLTMIAFAVINFGLYKIDSHLFSVVGVPSFFNFVWYSFNRLLCQSVPEIVPAQMWSQAFSMIEQLLYFVVWGVFLTLFFSFKNQRQTSEINRVVSVLKKKGEFLENFIKDEYKIMCIEDAMAELRNAKVAFVGFILGISENLDE